MSLAEFADNLSTIGQVCSMAVHRFRLNSATMAVHYRHDDQKGVALIIPAGSEVISHEVVDGRPGFDRSKLVAVEWDGRTVCMFLLDLLERGERVQQAGG